MTASSKSLTKLLVAVLVIAGALYVAFYGATLFGRTIPGALDKQAGIKQGLDLRGGSIITYEAQTDTATDAEMATVVSMLRARLDKLGYTEATITRQGVKKVRIEIPDISNPEEAVKTIGQTAKLTFVDSDNKVILDGVDVKDARQQFGPLSQSGKSENFVELSFTPEGKTKFAEATARISALPQGKNFIAIKLDENVQSQPSVKEKIDSENCIISGSFTAKSAAALADLIRAGKLPFDLKDVELRSVGPTLGERAMQTSMYAGIIGVILILLFMLVMYRLPGLLADIALVAYIALVVGLLTIFRVNLSLPGIAGIILSIGMAVDANVIIFERMKEELALGKTVGASIDAGFNRAFASVLDSNVTALISAAVLLYFGTGPVKGFAITLGLGILTSMFTAIVITRFLLRQIVALNIRNPKLYRAGIKGGISNV